MDKIKIKGISDAGDLYNYLSYNGIIKGMEREFISGEEGYTSRYYQKFKNSFYGRFLNGFIQLELLGEYNIYNKRTILLKATCADGNQGIVDLKGFKTIVPLKYCAINMIGIGDDKVVFITDRIDEKEHMVLKSMYSIEGKCVIEDCIEIVPAYVENIKYEIENRKTSVAEMTFALQKEKVCDELLLKKRFSIFTNPIIKNLVEEAEDCEMDVIYQDNTHFSLYETLKYSAYRTKKKNEALKEKIDKKEKEETNVDVEVVIKTELLKKENEAFVEKYLPEHRVFKYFFDNEIFDIVEEN